MLGSAAISSVSLNSSPSPGYIGFVAFPILLLLHQAKLFLQKLRFSSCSKLFLKFSDAAIASLIALNTKCD
ncbi:MULTISPECIES: hypothetical protein [unclassified Pseudoalteromonas]|uniref:hypothetical protein n=1 Tax=unclassified Pseudoalteromonas TaxID=194690 RepID=UPI001300C269|nr:MULTISPECIES: hypothetical protein [unclassified Pseudoalteromonas]